MRALYSRLRFLVNIDCNIPQVLYGDAGHIRQVLVYLLNNAILFTDRGFGYFSLSVTAERTEGSTVYLTIEVSDNGRGIEAEQLEHLFDETRFNHISRLQEHSDLRLPTIKKIITSMGGDIRVASKVGQGTTFTVVLPQKIESPGKLCEVENADEISILIYERRDQCTQSIKCTLNNLGIAHTTVTSAADFYQALKSRKFSFVFAATFLYERAMREYPQLETDAKIVLVEEFGDDIPDHGYSVLSTPIYTINVTNIINTAIDTNGDDNTRKTVRRFSAPKARVLVVDDIYNSLQITTGCLLPYHMQIDLSLSGADALNNIKDTHYDLIFIDHMMPDMNGPETLARIRAMGNRTARHKKTPVIALTANAASHIRDLLMTSGFNDYLSKPIDTIKLNMVLEKWLSKDLIVTK
jgi:CheY-like chemotaxis protein